MEMRNPYLNPKSLPSRFRRRRFATFQKMIDETLAAKGRCHVLDLGGTRDYWQIHDDVLAAYGDKLHIFLVNLEETTDPVQHLARYTAILGDITRPETYSLVDYDLIHSNSAIEHVGGWTAVKLMADCMKASGRPYFLQTPNYWFPLEPHFRFVGWQWLPESWRASLLTAKSRGFFRKALDYEEAMMHVESVKLLTLDQLRHLFPGARIDREWLGPFIKSFMAINDSGTYANPA
jgi:hypothetical protein